VKQQREANQNVMLVDAGDALVGGGPLGDQTQGKAIIAGMNLMGYEAMALGPKELSLGAKLLRERMDEAKFPVVSANVTSGITNRLFADPYAVVDVGTHRVGIIGITRQPTPDETISDFTVADPRAATTRLVPEVKAKADTIVVLTNLDYASAMQLAREVPGIDLIIAGSQPEAEPGTATRAPGTGTIVVSAELPAARHSGRRVGRLAATLESTGRITGEAWESVWMDKSLADDPDMATLLEGFQPPPPTWAPAD
jgi:2',3'-cyclic-nucleotide 2'-phosphodiesterase (5'-nucleotidase family)